jgi:hypothetical protein
MYNYYIGIDNGINGGIIVLDSKQNIISKHIMPVLGKTKKEYDINVIKYLLDRYNDNSLIILEKAQPQFRDGRKQAFKTGYGYGVLQGVLTALNISFQIVSPKIWQKKIFEGLQSDDTKTASIMFCKRKWPKEDWTATERSTKYHDGLTDAACMAYYGVLINE